MFLKHELFSSLLVFILLNFCLVGLLLRLYSCKPQLFQLSLHLDQNIFLNQLLSIDSVKLGVMLDCLLFVLLNACGMLVNLSLDIDHFLGKSFEFNVGIMHTASDLPVDFPLVVGIQEFRVVYEAGQTLPLMLGHCQFSDNCRATDTLVPRHLAVVIQVSLIVLSGCKYCSASAFQEA